MSETNEQQTSQEDAVQENISQPVVELPGRRLREQRENRHLSLDEVAHHLRLDVQLIDSLEKDDYSDLPSPAYTCGYLRSYARLLKLPEDEVVHAYTHGEQINEALIPSTVSIKFKPRKTSKSGLIKTVAIIVITILIAGGLYLLEEKYNFFSLQPGQKSSELTLPVAPVADEKKDDQAADVNKGAATESVPATTAATDTQQSAVQPVQVKPGKTVVENLPTPKTKIPEDESINSAAGQATAEPQASETTPASDNTSANETAIKSAQLKLHFNGDSWAEVSDSTGKRLLYRLVVKNTNVNLDGVPPFTILLGNAPVVQVYYDGKEFDHSRYHRNEVGYFKVGTK